MSRKTNITLKLDAGLVRQLRVLAAEKGRSISSLLEGHLQQVLSGRRDFKAARRRALLRLEKGFELHWAPTSRDEVHQR